MSKTQRRLTMTTGDDYGSDMICEVNELQFAIYYCVKNMKTESLTGNHDHTLQVCLVYVVVVVKIHRVVNRQYIHI